MTFEQEYDDYRINVETQRKNFLSKIILTACDTLKTLNNQIRTTTDHLNNINSSLLLAKAFRSATQASSYLYKQRETEEPRTNRNEGNPILREPITSLRPSTSKQQYFQDFSNPPPPTTFRPLFSQIVGGTATSDKEQLGTNQRNQYNQTHTREKHKTENFRGRDTTMMDAKIHNSSNTDSVL